MQRENRIANHMFVHFKIDGMLYLAYANISHNSVIYRWNGKKFVAHQTLKGLGGRNFLFFKQHGKSYILRINFITGSRKSPKTALLSPLYEWKKGRFEWVQSIQTHGGVSAAQFRVDGQSYIGVANSLSRAIRFRTDSVVYKVGVGKSA